MAMSLLGDTSHLFIEFKPNEPNPQPNPLKSKEAGRPIYDDVEHASIQHVGDPKTWSWHPAHERSIYIREPGGGGNYKTYAECYYEHYKAFKEGQSRAQSGTPIEELPFLSSARRAELKALNIHTAEALAQLDGTPLTRLGMGGREMKNQAQAYLDRAKEGAMEARLAAQNAQLQEELARMREQVAGLMDRHTKTLRRKKEEPDPEEAGPEDEEPAVEASAFESWSDNHLRAFIKERTGTGVRGQPAHATLVAMAEEASVVDPRIKSGELAEA